MRVILQKACNIEKKQMKKQKGITLIALVITIIVIVILAVVSVNMIIGNNGIITKAQWSVEADKQGKALEEITLAWGAFQVDWQLVWANNKTVEFSSFVTKEILQKYVGINGIIEDVKNNGNKTYTIEYKSNNSDKSCIFLVTEDGEVTILNGIKIKADNLSLQVVTDGQGETTKETALLKALVTNVPGTINWEITSGVGVVSLSSTSGNQIQVTAESGGIAVIKASSADGNYEDSIEIEVTESIAIQTIGTLSAGQTTINKNRTTTVSVPNIVPANATEILSWTISDSNVAVLTPSADGKSVTVAGVGSGTVVVTATALNGDTESIEITVVVPVTGISINEAGPIEISVDETSTLSITLEPIDATNKNVVWSITPNDDSIASLSAISGNSITVSGISAGNCTVTVTSENGGYTDSINITVKSVEMQQASELSSIITSPAISEGTGTLSDPYVMTVQEGKTGTISVEVKDENGSTTKANSITYTSGTPAVATITPETATNVSSSTATVYGVSANATGSVMTIAIDTVTKYVKVVVSEISSFGEALRVNEYGYKVKGYVSAGTTSLDWRLFYQDSENTYLLAAVPQGSYLPSSYYAGSGETRYTNGASVSDEGKMLNGRLNSKYPEVFQSSNTNANIRAVAWMTDTENTLWSKYKDSAGKASWAVASPSMELFVASFNAVKADIDIKRATGVTEEAARTAISCSPASTKGYSYNTSNGLNSNYNHGIYNYSSSSTWWLSSPSHGTSATGVCVQGRSNRISDFSVSQFSSYAVRPLVCIPTSTFNAAVIAGTYILKDE